MFEEERPTAVSIVGWVWVVSGPLMVLSAGSVLVLPLLDAGFRFPFDFRLYVLMSVLEGLAGGVGFFAGISFLRLRPWSRVALELVTWLTMVAILVASMAFWRSMPGLPLPILAAGMGMAILYCVPLLLVVRALRSKKVRSALASSADIESELRR